MKKFAEHTGPSSRPQIRVETRYNPALIEQRLVTDIFGNGRGNELWRGTIDLQEQGIRKALIDLGWKPPK